MWEILRRAAFSVLALFVISFLVFLLTNVVPGSPASAVLAVDTPEEEILAWEREHNLHLPVTEQYAIWLRKTLGGDLGLGEGFVYESRGKVDLRQLPMRLVPVRSDQDCCSQTVFGLAEVITNGVKGCQVVERIVAIVRSFSRPPGCVQSGRPCCRAALAAPTPLQQLKCSAGEPQICAHP